MGVGVGSGAAGTTQYVRSRTSTSIASRASTACSRSRKQPSRVPLASVRQKALGAGAGPSGEGLDDGDDGIADALGDGDSFGPTWIPAS